MSLGWINSISIHSMEKDGLRSVLRYDSVVKEQNQLLSQGMIHTRSFGAPVHFCNLF